MDSTLTCTKAAHGSRAASNSGPTCAKQAQGTEGSRQAHKRAGRQAGRQLPPMCAQYPPVPPAVHTHAHARQELHCRVGSIPPSHAVPSCPACSNPTCTPGAPLPSELRPRLRPPLPPGRRPPALPRVRPPLHGPRRSLMQTWQWWLAGRQSSSSCRPWHLARGGAAGGATGGVGVGGVGGGVGRSGHGAPTVTRPLAECSPVSHCALCVVCAAPTTPTHPPPPRSLTLVDHASQHPVDLANKHERAPHAQPRPPCAASSAWPTERNTG